MLFITETTTYVYERHPERAAVYVLVETRPRQADESPTPNPFKTEGVWVEKPNGSFIWSPE
jgi:hypothetical protein